VPNPLSALRDVPVRHWRGDTFDLPGAAPLLAWTGLTRNQAFFRDPNALGIQFIQRFSASLLSIGF